MEHDALLSAAILGGLAMVGHAVWLTLRRRRWQVRRALWDMHRTNRAPGDEAWHVDRDGNGPRVDAFHASILVSIERAKKEPSRLLQVLYPSDDGIGFTVDRDAFRRDLTLVEESHRMDFADDLEGLRLVREEVAESELLA